jgi:hypothetical protein
MFFKQRTARLYNGQRVKEGDRVKFVNSDGVTCIGTIQRDVNNLKRLFFWNNGFDITDYKNAIKCDL